MYVFVSRYEIQTTFRQHSDNIQFIGDIHIYTFMQIHAHTTMFESHSYMYECDSKMIECGMNVHVSSATFSKINQFVSCMDVVKDTYTFKHAGSLMKFLLHLPFS